MVRRTVSCQRLFSIHCRYPIVVKVTDGYSGIQMFGNNLCNKLSIFFLSRNDRLFTRSRICKRKSPVARCLQNIAFCAFTEFLSNWEFQFIISIMPFAWRKWKQASKPSQQPRWLYWHSVLNSSMQKLNFITFNTKIL